MGYIDIGYGSGSFIFKAYNTDLKCFIAIKSRTKHTCSICKRNIPSKSYIYSSDWFKFCLKCGEEVSNKGIEGYQNIIKHIKFNQKILKKNKDKWETENALALL